MTRDEYRDACAEAGVPFTEGAYWTYVNIERRLLGKDSIEEMAETIARTLGDVGVSARDAANAIEQIGRSVSAASPDVERVVSALRNMHSAFEQDVWRTKHRNKPTR